jgi:hypothetical protein
LPAYPSLRHALDRKIAPAFISDPEVVSWLASARELNSALAQQLRFLALRRAAGFEENTAGVKVGISISILILIWLLKL